MPFGLSQDDLDYIDEVMQNFPEVEKAVVFGSRAMGNYKKGSDVDIALIGDKVNFSILAAIKDKLQEESPMPYMFDIVDFTHSDSDALKQHIKQYGIEIYCQDK